MKFWSKYLWKQINLSFSTNILCLWAHQYQYALKRRENGLSR